MLTNFRCNETCEAIIDVLKEMNSDSEDYEAILTLFASLSDVWVSSLEGYMKRDEKCLLPLIKSVQDRRD